LNLLGTKKRKIKSKIILSLCLLIVLAIVWILFVGLEGEKPTISIDMSSASMGGENELKGMIADRKSGSYCHPPGFVSRVRL